MRKRYRVFIFAALVAALIVPVGYALSIDTTHNASNTRYATVIPTAAASVAAPIIRIDHVEPAAAAGILAPLTDSTKLLFIGTVLFGLAAAVRKAI